MAPRVVLMTFLVASLLELVPVVCNTEEDPTTTTQEPGCCKGSSYKNQANCLGFDNRDDCVLGGCYFVIDGEPEDCVITTTSTTTTTEDPGCCAGDSAKSNPMCNKCETREQCEKSSSCHFVSGGDVNVDCVVHSTPAPILPAPITTATTLAPTYTPAPITTSTYETMALGDEARNIEKDQHLGYDVVDSGDEAADDSLDLAVLAASLACVAVVVIGVALFYALRRKNGKAEKVSDEMIVEDNIPDDTVEMFVEAPSTR